MLRSYQEKLVAMTGFVEENFTDVSDLCDALDISTEHIVQLFPDRLVAYYSKYFPPDVDDEDVSDEYEEDAWRGFRVYTKEE